MRDSEWLSFLSKTVNVTAISYLHTKLLWLRVPTRVKHAFIFRHELLQELSASSNTLLLYPTPNSIDILELPKSSHHRQYSLIMLDGTWSQAKQIYRKNAWLHSLQSVAINIDFAYMDKCIYLFVYKILRCRYQPELRASM